MVNHSGYNRILYSGPLFCRQFYNKTKKLYHVIPDFQSIPFIIEELVAFGALEIVLPFKLPKSSIQTICEPLRKRISFVSGKEESKLAKSFLLPIFNEFGIEAEANCIAWRYPKDFPTNIMDAIQILHASISPFLLGIKHKIQIDIDVFGLKNAVSLLRGKVTSSRLRANLAILEGVLNTYEDISVDSICIRSHAPTEHISIFEDLVNDEHYRQLSNKYYRLGMPQYLKRGLMLIKRQIRKLLSRQKYRMALDIALRNIQAATKIPLLDSEVLNKLFIQNYLPIIISIQIPISTAKKKWKSSDSTIVQPYWEDGE